MHDIQRTTNFRFQYNKLNLRFKRMVDEAADVLKESPTDFQSKITYLGNRKDGGLYRFRLPGCYLLYVIPEHEEGSYTTITLTTVKLLH